MEPPNAPDWTVTGYAVMFLFFSAALAAEEVVRERDNHTLERLVASGASRGVIIGGKMLGTAARAAVQAAILWGAGIFLFGMTVGTSPWPLIVITLAFIFAASGFAVMIAAGARTLQAASSAAVVTSLLAAPLGGCWWPLFIAPRWLQTLGRITPHAWANISLNRVMLFGAGLFDVWVEVGVLILFGVVFSGVALSQFSVES